MSSATIIRPFALFALALAFMPSSASAADDARKVVAIDVKIEKADTLYEMAYRQIKEIDREEELEKEKAARDPNTMGCSESFAVHG